MDECVKNIYVCHRVILLENYHDVVSVSCHLHVPHSCSLVSMLEASIVQPKPI